MEINISGPFTKRLLEDFCIMGPFTKRLYANDEKALTSRICGILQIYYEDFRKIQEMLFAFLVASSNLLCEVCWK